MANVANARGWRVLAGGAASEPQRSPNPPALAPKPLWPPGEVNLTIRNPTLAKWFEDVAGAKGFKWASEIKIGVDQDTALIQRLFSDNPRNHVELLNFGERLSQYPPWYLSALCLRLKLNSRLWQCAGLPSMVVLCPMKAWDGAWQFEREKCVEAGLIRGIKLEHDFLDNWDEKTITRKVEEWTSELKTAAALPPSHRPTVLTPQNAPPPTPRQYYVYMFSPGDTKNERAEVIKFFEEENDRCDQDGYSFRTLQWESIVDADLGDPQQLVFNALRKPAYQPVVCAIFILKHRMGGAPGRVSGTLQEWEEVLRLRETNPDLTVKLFYREEEFTISPSEPDPQAAFDQFMAVKKFREDQKKNHDGMVKEFKEGEFVAVLRKDLAKWIGDPARPWKSGNRLGFNYTPQR